MTLRPRLKITVDGQDLSASEAALVSLRVELRLGSMHDRFTAFLSHQSPVADLDAGTAVEIALGYGDATEAVFTGDVVAVERLAGVVCVEGLARTHALARTRAAQSYLDQTVADIVRDLLGKGGVDAGDIDASLKLAVHHVDERRTIWAHIVDLARLASCDLIAAADGSLDCRPPRSGPTPDHTLRHGADMLAWSVGPRTPLGDPPAVVPYGAASEAGAEKWHLLLREPDRGSPSAPTRVVEALRDRDGARALESGLQKAAQRRTLAGRIVIVGNSAIRPGDVLKLSDLPNGEDCIARALAVSHGFDGAAGFRTAIGLEGVAR
jgi:phage protein D